MARIGHSSASCLLGPQDGNNTAGWLETTFINAKGKLADRPAGQQQQPRPMGRQELYLREILVTLLIEPDLVLSAQVRPGGEFTWPAETGLAGR